MRRMRLDKLLADAGIGSRTEVKLLIRKGRISVNGIVVNKSDHKVDFETDTILFDQEQVSYHKNVYYMLNKPSGIVSATTDNHDTTVIDLFEKENRQGLFPVGRLDKDTTGLMVITDDGAFAHKVLSPRKHIPKTYVALLDEALLASSVDALENGLDIGDAKLTLPATVRIEESNREIVHLTIMEGRFHQVKRMFQVVGRSVLSLKRIQIGNLLLDQSLSEGSYKALTKEEAFQCLETSEMN